MGAAGLQARQQPAVPAASRPCRASGRVSSGSTPLPGATVTAVTGDKVVAMTSTDVDGSYSVALAPGSYRLKAELSAFVPVEQEMAVGEPPCATQADFSLLLVSRAPASVIASAPAPSAPVAVLTPAPTVARGAATGRGQGRVAGGAQAAGAFGQPRFQELSVQESAANAGDSGTVDLTSVDRANDPAAQLLPAGFSIDAPAEALTVNGSMVDINRAQMNDRMQALARGDFGLAQGQFAPAGGAGPGGAFGAVAVDGGAPGARGGPPGGFGGPGAFGGRLGGANRLQAQASYSLGSSLLDAAPYPLGSHPQTKPDYTQQTTSITLGGPFKLGRWYDGTQRTTFNLSYTATRNGSALNQYATVPSLAMRQGDFSALPYSIINPQTGQPFAGNQVPVSATAQTLLQFVPTPNLPGDTQNYYNSSISHASTDQFTVRFTHSLTKPQAGRGRGAGGGTGRGGATQGQQPPSNAPAPGAPAPGATASGASAPGQAPSGTPAAGARQGGGGQTGANGRQGGGGRGAFQLPLSATVNATVTYRRNDGDRLNVYPALDGTNVGSTLSVPVTLTVRKGRTTNTFNVSFNQTRSDTVTPFAYNVNVAAAAGINGVSPDPFDWGPPTIAFGSSGLTGLRSVSPAERTDRAYQLGYTWLRTIRTHNLRAGATYQRTTNDTRSDTSPNGSFTFGGLYSAEGQQIAQGSAYDFADFLLGLPQLASQQYGVTLSNTFRPVNIRGHQYSAFLQDDWRWKPRWTINWGVEYDFVSPFTEANGRIVNLDVAPGFAAVAPVEPGDTGPFTGAFPIALVYPDRNNVAPRIGAAWRANSRTVVRFGYGLTYNTGTYSNIARQLYQQPPFFSTSTASGSLDSPLSITDAFSNLPPSTVTNNYGIDKNYRLGMIHQWTADYSRDLFRSWNVGVTYIGTLGRGLDLLRAPNRGPTGPRDPSVEPFMWQSSDGMSHANGVSFRLQKRQTNGVSGNVIYTLSKAMDDTTATTGNPTVAQDDQNLAAEWGPSSFDRRHQVSGSLSVQLPWGINRQWLNTGGWIASMAGGWTAITNVTWNSGTPLTIRCSTCAADLASGVPGTLRANYNGEPVSLASPSTEEFFNTAAFTVPPVGTFGTSLRNMVIGPGSHLVNLTISRDVQLGGNRGMTIAVAANNLLNTVNYAAIDTNVNSRTFGEVLSVQGMRTIHLNLRFRF